MTYQLRHVLKLPSFLRQNYFAGFTLQVKYEIKNLHLQIMRYLIARD